MASVADVMSTNVVTVVETDTLGHVARELRKHNVGSAVVTSESRDPVGIVTERILVDSVAASRNPDVGQAGTWMVPLRKIEPTASVDEAIEAIQATHLRYLAVCDGKGGIMGIVSVSDLLKALV